MEEAIGGPPQPHLYTATEVQQRLEKQMGHPIGFSGTSGTLWPYSNELFESKIVKPAGYAAAHLRADMEMRARLNQMPPIILNTDYSFEKKRKPGLRGFIDEAIAELKAYFTKKENKHAE